MVNRSEPRSEGGVRDTRCLSLFTGAGGLDWGLRLAGWQPIAAVEPDPDCVATLELADARFRSAEGGDAERVIASVIEMVDPGDLRRDLGLARGELPLIAGGPPCQPFTTHGLRRSINDARACGVWPSYLEYLREFQPQAFVIENVDGLLSAALWHRPLAERPRNGLLSDPDERKGSFLLWFLRQVVPLGYSVVWGLVEAADFGVPQLRQRSIIIGTRGSDPCYLPGPAFGPPGLPPYRTVRDSIAGLADLGPVQPLSERKRRVYELIPPGGNWRDLPDAVQRETMGRAHAAEGGKSGWWRRLDWGLPAPTILGMPDHSSTALVHPDETRCLSVRECAILQSFPADYEFVGTPRSQYQQIGNAVPPQVGRAIGQRVAGHLDGLRQREPEPPKWRKASANRRIGTHGWVVWSGHDEPRLVLRAKVRPDHIWADRKEVGTWLTTASETQRTSQPAFDFAAA